MHVSHNLLADFKYKVTWVVWQESVITENLVRSVKLTLYLVAGREEDEAASSSFLTV